MNKKTSTFILILLFSLLIALFFYNRKTQISYPKSYSESVSYAKKVSLSEIQNKIQAKESFVLYIGRESCPYCQRFAPKLAVAIQKTNQSIYYLDNDSSERKGITEFAQNEDIKTVPNLSFFKEGKKVSYLEKGSKASIKEITDFITNIDQ